MAHGLQRLVIGDDGESWRSAGFDVEAGELTLGSVTIEFAGTGADRGVLGWSLAGVTSTIESIPTVGSHAPPTRRSENPNAVFAIDHVVVETGDIDRTVAALADVGIEERRRARMETPLGERQQSFLWAGRVILEVVGPVAPDPSAKMGIWGLALVSSNLEITGNVIGEHLSEPRDAVQPGRKITIVDTKALDISVPIAVLSPRESTLGTSVETPSTPGA